jgi:hypothetical protein
MLIPWMAGFYFSIHAVQKLRVFYLKSAAKLWICVTECRAGPQPWSKHFIIYSPPLLTITQRLPFHQWCTLQQQPTAISFQNLKNFRKL